MVVYKTLKAFQRFIIGQICRKKDLNQLWQAQGFGKQWRGQPSQQFFIPLWGNVVDFLIQPAVLLHDLRFSPLLLHKPCQRSVNLALVCRPEMPHG